MSNAITDIIMKPEFFGKIYAIANKTSARVQRLGEMPKYTVMTETIPTLDLYGLRPRTSEDVAFGDLLEVGTIRKRPMIQQIRDNSGNQTGSFVKFVYLADSVKTKEKADLSKMMKAEEQYVKPNTGNGDITDGCDFEKTLGELLLLSATPVDEYVGGVKTGQIDHILVITRSEQNDETYDIKVSNVDTAVLKMPMFTKLKMVKPTGRVFADVSQVETGAITLALSAEDVEEVKAPQKQEMPKQQPTQSSEKDNNKK